MLWLIILSYLTVIAVICATRNSIIYINIDVKQPLNNSVVGPSPTINLLINKLKLFNGSYLIPDDSIVDDVCLPGNLN